MINRIKSNNPKILVVGAKREEINHLEKCLIEFKYEITILYDNSTDIVASTPESPTIILVYAQDEQMDTVAIYEQVRKYSERKTVSILLVKGKFKLSQYFELYRYEQNIKFIKNDFNQEEILAKIEKFSTPHSQFIEYRTKNSDLLYTEGVTTWTTLTISYQDILGYFICINQTDDY